MEKEKSHSLGLPPTSSRYPFAASPTNSGISVKSESSEISRMPDFPVRNIGHRRAHSEILSLPDDISFDSDLGVVGSVEGPSISDDTEEDLLSMYMDMEKFGSVGFQFGESSAGNSGQSEGFSERPRVRHQHSQSMDGTTSIKPEMLAGGPEGYQSVDAKKAMSAAKLADLALVDPKRAKRIWANRQSAARSKERKMRYIAELERKVQTLQTEATTLSAQLTMLQRDNSSLSAENNELKLRLQTMEQQVNLQDALNETLREEVQRLKGITGQSIPNGSPMMNLGPSTFGGSQPFYPHNHHSVQSLLAAQQLQQLQLHSQRQLPPQPVHHGHQENKVKVTLTSPGQTRDGGPDNRGA